MTDLAIAEIYSNRQRGGELPYFIGRQYGGGWLRTLGRIAFPIIKRLAGVAARTAEDVIMKDEKILPSLSKNTFQEVRKAISGSAATSKRRQRARRSSINKRRKLTGTIYS